MPQLVQLVYSSAAVRPFAPDEIEALLLKSAVNNSVLGVTGMLLYEEESFFQVLEGESGTVRRLFEMICKDSRHVQVTEIIFEPIAERSFSEWSMGYAPISPEDAARIVGGNDFFTTGHAFTRLDEGRAKKLLDAFRQGRWRTVLRGRKTPGGVSGQKVTEMRNIPRSELPERPGFSFLFQPIVDLSSGTISAYEALLRGVNGEGVGSVLGRVDPSEIHRFDRQCRLFAIELAGALGIEVPLHLNCLPGSLADPEAAVELKRTLERCGIKQRQIVLEILEHENVPDARKFSEGLNAYRGGGMRLAIDDFGSGYAGLNLLADFQPDIIKLDMELVRNIDHKGARQAIVRGIMRTCFDLGIDIIAEGVETEAEYRWLSEEGITLFQGWLFAKGEFEALCHTFASPRGSGGGD